MQAHPTRLHPIALLLLGLLLVPPLPAYAARLALPVAVAGAPAPAAPYFAGDRLLVRLRPAASQFLSARRAGPTRSGLQMRSGLNSLDAVAASLGGATFEPEFVGEHAPDPASGDTLDFSAFMIVHIPEGASLEAALERFAASPDVMSAEPIPITRTSALPNDSLFAQQVWLHKDILPRVDNRVLDAWSVEQGDTNIVIGVVDTGIIPYHPDLGGITAGLTGNMYVNRAEAGGLPGVDDDHNGFIDDVGGWDFVANASAASAATGEDWRDQDNDPNDFAGHGTTVAGVIGALIDNTIGMAGMVPNARLMPLRIGWQPAGGTPPNGDVSMDYAAQAIRYATLMHVQVLNCSFSSLFLSSLDAAVTAASRAGTALVVASGNGNDPAYLGQREDVIAVAGVDSSDVIWPGSVLGAWVDLSADATGIVSTFLKRTTPDSVGARQPSYRGFLNGTSYAAPQVASALALMQAQRLHQGRVPYTVAGAVMRLRETADDISALNTGTGYGAGRLDVYRALTDRTGSLAVRTRSRQVGPPVILRENTGRSRILIAANDKTLVAYDGASGDTLWRVVLPAVPAGDMAAAPIGAGVVGVFIPTANGRVLGYTSDGVVLAGWPQVGTSGQQMTGGVALGDLDGDGLPEVVCSAVDGRVFAWHANGALLANFPFDMGVIGSGVPALGELDGVPGDEIAIVGGDNQVHVITQAGIEAPGWPIAAPPGTRAPVIARLGHAGPVALIVGGNGSITAYRGDGTSLWTRAFTGTLGQDLALGDLDGDGADEVVYVTGGPTTVSVCDSAGAVFSRQNWPLTPTGTPAGALAIGPLRAGHNAGVCWLQSTGLVAYDDSAQVVRWVPKSGIAGVAPALADLDGDGATKIVAGIALADSNLYVYDAGAGSFDAAKLGWPTPRGDESRRANHASPPLLGVIDRIRPARVNDLVAQSLTTTSARVTWTMTGDDSLAGAASATELRYAAFPLDASNFIAGQRVLATPVGATGTRDTVLVSALAEGQLYYFALRVSDAAGNLSAVSNVDTVAMAGVAPATVTDLRVTVQADTAAALTWTAVGDDGNVGRPASYTIAASLAPVALATFDASARLLTVAATVDAGGTEHATLSGLTRGERWNFALVATDHTATRSGLSNPVALILPVGGALRGHLGVAVAQHTRPSGVPVVLDWQGAAEAVGTPQTLSIHDLSGRIVRSLLLGTAAGGSVNWDGRDGESRLLPAGLYFARLSSGGFHAQTRIVLVP